MHIHIRLFSGPRKHGGFRRSEQLSCATRLCGATIINAEFNRSNAISLIIKHPHLLFMFIISQPAGFIKYLSKIGLVKFIIFGAYFYILLKINKAKSVSAELGAGLGMLPAFVALKLHILDEVYPHNIEYLVPRSVNKIFNSKVSEYAFELNIYNNAPKIYTISSFDAAVLTANGVSGVELLEYRPVDIFFDELLRIKDARKNFSNKQGVLLLGSVGNSPTFDSMTQLFKLISASQTKLEFKLVGFGTESLKHIAPKTVKFLGSISDQELASQLVKCKAALIYQQPTSGMLTRIIELLIVGIPVFVIGKYIQAEVLSGKGVYLIDNVNQLENVILDFPQT